MKKLTKKEVLAMFKQEVLPVIREKEAEYRCGHQTVDTPMRREEWNNYVDYLYSDKLITQRQLDNWSNPY